MALTFIPLSKEEVNHFVQEHPWIPIDQLSYLLRSTDYLVAVIAHPGYTHLRINRLDRKPITSWEELQNIKNSVMDPEVFAMQVFPPESRTVNRANTYHLFVPDVQTGIPDLTEFYDYESTT